MAGIFVSIHEWGCVARQPFRGPSPLTNQNLPLSALPRRPEPVPALGVCFFPFRPLYGAGDSSAAVSFFWAGGAEPV